jgi:hypothetical protein
MEAELARLMAEIDAAAYVIDCLPNMNGPLVAERTPPFVRALREARPDTPILLVEDRSFTNSTFRASRREHQCLNDRSVRRAPALDHAMQDWQRESGGLARARLGAPEQIPACEQMGNRLRLDGCRCQIPCLLDGAAEMVRQP